MTREEANARLAELVAEVSPKLEEVYNLCREHGLSATLLNHVGGGVYRQNLTVDRYGEFSSWDSSEEETWESSDWDSSSC